MNLDFTFVVNHNQYVTVESNDLHNAAEKARAEWHTDDVALSSVTEHN